MPTKINKDFHQKPSSKERSVGDALARAEIKRNELPKIVQVFASDWDVVILADEVTRLREYEWMYNDLCK